MVRVQKTCKMKKYVVASRVPTSHQMSSIYKLMGSGNVNRHMDGSLSARVEFDSLSEALDYLKTRIDVLFEDQGTDEEYEKMLEVLKTYHTVSWDAAFARIEEEDIEVDEEE